jgi:uncharacterized linocin/CFP29 family protein
MPNGMNGWSEVTWKEINDGVLKEVGQIRVAQKVFPTAKLDNPQTVPDDTLNLVNFSIEEGRTKPLVEISAGFPLTPNQATNEATEKGGQKLARLRAKDVALTEDLVVFQGTGAVAPPGVAIRNANNQSVGTGLLGLATPAPGFVPQNAPIPVPLILPAARRVGGLLYGENTFNAVVTGIARLNAQQQPGPYALILEFSILGDTNVAVGANFTTTADRINPVVAGGLFGTAALPARTGLLVSLGGEPTTLYVGVDTTTSFAQKDANENHLFRVFERIQFNARDPRAFVRLDFEAP